MPTGYTAIINDKPNITLKEFTLRCARAFGACIEQRDDDINKLPKKQVVSTYHLDELNKAIKELNHFKNTPKKQLLKEMAIRLEKLKVDSKKQNEKCRKEKAEMKKNYESMLEKVNKWEIPSIEHQGLKNFMISQITESMDWDCKEYPDSEIDYTTEEFYNKTLNDLKRDIKYHEEKYNDEVKRVNSQNKWIGDVYKSFN